MSRVLTEAEIAALKVPTPVEVAAAGRYTIAGLFQSGTFGPDEETAIEEIRAIRQAFGQMTSPSRGWMTPRYGSGPPATPRILANGPAWRRYTSWRERWAAPAVARSPSYPWGLSAADLACMALLEPWNITDLARLSGKSDLLTVELLVRVVTDYGSELKRERARIWEAWDAVDATTAARRLRRRRMKGAERARRYRKKK